MESNKICYLLIDVPYLTRTVRFKYITAMVVTSPFPIPCKVYSIYGLILQRSDALRKCARVSNSTHKVCITLRAKCTCMWFVVAWLSTNKPTIYIHVFCVMVYICHSAWRTSVQTTDHHGVLIQSKYHMSDPSNQAYYKWQYVAHTV